MCLGAAVGAGFAAFESAGYAMNYLLTEGDSGMFNNLAIRGLLAPFGHVVWTAIAAGAVWRVKGDRPFSLEMLQDRRCFAPIVAVMVLHAIWNSPLPALLPFMLGYFALGAVAWTIAVGMMLSGLRELREAATGGRAGGTSMAP
jgi:RsiW-degrading membrane proteinase PrsW (M82 family)